MQAWGIGLCDVYCRFSNNCYPRTTRVSYHFCAWNMEYGNSTRFCSASFLFLGIYIIFLLLTNNNNFFCSVFTLCRISNRLSFHSGLPFFTTMWAHKRASLHWHLFVDGFSLSKSFWFLSTNNYNFVSVKY